MARMAAPIPASATLAEARDLWRRSLEAANKAPKTIVTYLFAVDRLAGQVGADRPINKITRADHEATLLSLKGRGGAEAQPASVSTVYRSLRAFWGWVVTAEDLPVKRDPMNGMRGPPNVTPGRVRWVIQTPFARRWVSVRYWPHVN